jgi:hypothetical protein
MIPTQSLFTPLGCSDFSEMELLAWCDSQTNLFIDIDDSIQIRRRAEQERPNDSTFRTKAIPAGSILVCLAFEQSLDAI